MGARCENIQRQRRKAKALPHPVSVTRPQAARNAISCDVTFATSRACRLTSLPERIDAFYGADYTADESERAQGGKRRGTRLVRRRRITRKLASSTSL
ncbi:hypothetical protein LSAT2_032901 [Lamellibrachia satsuma]|nr:hypothetical protein LSAT2_032901 [Lamellibrachia satsuma]